MRGVFHALTICAVAALLAAGAQAQVRFDDGGTKATGIDGLVVDDPLGLGNDPVGTFDVTFDVNAKASELYGQFPASEDNPVPLSPFFGVVEDFEDALTAASIELVAEGALSVGEVGQVGTDFYSVPGVAFVLLIGPIPPFDFFVGPFDSIAVGRVVLEGVDWIPVGENFLFWEGSEIDDSQAVTTYATFTPVPEPGTAFSCVAALGTLAVLARRRRRHPFHRRS